MHWKGHPEWWRNMHIYNQFQSKFNDTKTYEKPKRVVLVINTPNCVTNGIRKNQVIVSSTNSIYVQHTQQHNPVQFAHEWLKLSLNDTFDINNELSDIEIQSNSLIFWFWLLFTDAPFYDTIKVQYEPGQTVTKLKDLLLICTDNQWNHYTQIDGITMRIPLFAIYIVVRLKRFSSTRWHLSPLSKCRW